MVGEYDQQNYLHCVFRIHIRLVPHKLEKFNRNRDFSFNMESRSIVWLKFYIVTI